MPQPAGLPRTKFKTPEGRYNLVAQGRVLHPFNSLRGARLTLAPLTGASADSGLYVIWSDGGSCLHISGYAATHKEPIRSLPMSSHSLKATSCVTCHDFLPNTKDALDTLVGMSDGQVFLMSLQAQISCTVSSKVCIAGVVPPDPNLETGRCVAALWLPQTNQFMVAYSSGLLSIFKKSAVVHEGSSRFPLITSTHNKLPSPTLSFTVPGGGVNDAAVSPSPSGYIAAACRDGAVRLLSSSSGQVVGGFHSYYGAMLCCSFSHDGRYLAAGGEDDLVAVYSMSERMPVAHCQGHQSWVSRVRFDPWLQLGTAWMSGISGSQASSADAQIYRVASVGQDARLCIWDVQMVPTEGELVATPALGMRKSASMQKLEMSRKTSGELLAMLNQQPPPPQPTHQRKPSASALKSNAARGIVPSPSFMDMNIVLPICEHRLHMEPMSDLLFTEDLILTADHGGQVKTWSRPPKDELARRSVGPGNR